MQVLDQDLAGNAGKCSSNVAGTSHAPSIPVHPNGLASADCQD